jgi:hypothetical protein
MNHYGRPKIRNSIAGTLVAPLVLANAALAADFAVDFPAGVACVFEMRVDGTGGNQVYREFHDRDGNLVRLLFAGTGSALNFTNLSTGAALSLKGNGAVSHIALNPDGSATQVTTGHNVIILFPTDDPAGPSTTLYVGRVVTSIDSAGNYTLLKASGNSVDICAALS